MIDNGHPDIGHYEYVLVKRDRRKYKLLQSIFGDKTDKLIHYGEDKPCEDRVTMDITDYRCKNRI